MRPHLPYRLGFDQEKGVLVARGSTFLLDQLARVPGATRANRVALYDPTQEETLRQFLDDRVALPATRTSFLAAEAVAVPVEASDAYRRARREAMAGGPRTPLADVWRATGLNPEHFLPHQCEFIERFAEHPAVYNASEQGLGKTRMALLWLATRGARRVLIFTLKDLAEQWFNEQWALQMGHTYFVRLTEGLVKGRVKGIAPHVLEATSPTATTGHTALFVVNWEVLHALHKDLIRVVQPDCLVADESWKMLNPRAKVTKAALAIAAAAHARPDFKGAITLAGTPVSTNAGDLWPQLRLLDPERFSEPYQTFQRRYTHTKLLHLGPRVIEKPSGLKDPAELMMRVAPLWFRATEATCLDLPPPKFERVVMELPTDVRDLYDELATGRNPEALLRMDSPAVRTLRLHQLAGGHYVGPEVPDDHWEEGFASVHSPSLVEVASPKVDWVVQWAKDVLQPHPSTRAIIWCRYKAEVYRLWKLLEAALPAEHTRVQAVTGDVGFEISEEAKASFNSKDPDGVQVLVATISKMGVGHNLQAAAWALYFSNDWSYLKRTQSERRAQRIGREGSVRYVDLVARATVDEQVLAALAKRQDFSARVTPDTIAKNRGLTPPQKAGKL